MERLVYSVGILKGRISSLRQYGFRVLSHDFLALLAQGTAVYEDEVSGVKQVGAGSIVISPANLPHRYDPDQRQSWENYWVCYNREHAVRCFGELLPVENGVVSIQATETLKEAWRNLNDLYLHQRGEMTEYSNFLLHQILIQVFIQTKQVQIHKRTPLIEEAIQYMQSNMERDSLDFQRFAAKEGVSYHSFRLLFKKETGFPPKQYFLNLKMNMAQSLLMDTACNISEIADRLGFEDPYYFSRLFKEKNGVAPKAFRERFVRKCR